LSLRNDGHRSPEGGPERVTKKPRPYAQWLLPVKPEQAMNTILVIEDDWAVRELFAVELTSEGYNVVSIGEVESIKDKIESSRPDLVLLDIYRKGKDRWDVLNDIKKEDPRLSAIIVTAFDNYRNDPRLLLADGYVIKSSYFDDLKQKIREVLQRKGGS